MTGVQTCALPIYPSAPTTVADWAKLDGCAETPVADAKKLDLIAGGAAETTVTRFPGCKGGRDVELWTMDKGSHLPDLSQSFRPDLIDWLFSKKKN